MRRKEKEVHASLLLQLWDFAGIDRAESWCTSTRAIARAVYLPVETATTKLGKVHNNQEN